MNVAFVRGSSYISDNSKINPNYLTKEQKSDYTALVIKSKVIEAYNGSVPTKKLDEALSEINYENYCNNLDNSDQKVLLADIIKYQLFVYGIDTNNIDFREIVNRI